MFSGIIGTLSLIGGFVMAVVAGALLITQPWNLLWFIPLVWLLLRRIYKWFVRITSSAPLDPSMLYPPEFYDREVKPFTPAHRAVEAREKMERDMDRRMHEPITIGGHTRGHHG